MNYGNMWKLHVLVRIWGKRLTMMKRIKTYLLAHLLTLIFKELKFSVEQGKVQNIIQIHNNVLWDLRYYVECSTIQAECVGYSKELCQSHITLLWI